MSLKPLGYFLAVPEEAIDADVRDPDERVEPEQAGGKTFEH